MAVLGKNGFGVKLHALDGQRRVANAHDLVHLASASRFASAASCCALCATSVALLALITTGSCLATSGVGLGRTRMISAESSAEDIASMRSRSRLAAARRSNSITGTGPSGISRTTARPVASSSARSARRSVTSRACPGSRRHTPGGSFGSGGVGMSRSAFVRWSIRAATPARPSAALQVSAHRPRNAINSTARAAVRAGPFSISTSPQPFRAPPFSGFLALYRLKYCSGSRSIPSRCRSLNIKCT